MKTRNLTTISLFSAFICIFSFITIPIGSIPITLGIFAVFLTSLTLGVKKALPSVLIYILCGSVGLPVFGGFQGGVHILLGPTGGYIIGYIFIAFISGFASDIVKKFPTNKRMHILFPSCILAMTGCYITGTLHFSFICNISFSEALKICVYPFIVIDTLKIYFAIIISECLKKRIFEFIC